MDFKLGKPETKSSGVIFSPRIPYISRLSSICSSVCVKGANPCSVIFLFATKEVRLLGVESPLSVICLFLLPKSRVLRRVSVRNDSSLTNESPWRERDSLDWSLVRVLYL